MQELIKKTSLLQSNVTELVAQLAIEQLEAKRALLQTESVDSEFWSSASHAQQVMQQISKLDQRIEPWRDIEKRLAEISELLALDDASISEDATHQLQDIENELSALKKQLQFSGPNDDSDAILSIHAGAGGTDAQDWTQMLLRMYVRWAESHNYNTQIIQESAGEEAGIKSVTIEISGNFVYGKLRGEHGVHRLIRLSPFNSDNLRQTSFAKVEVLPKIDSPESVEIDDKDLKIDVYRSGGHGGQSVNTTDSAVRVTHLPTGIVVAIQNERSQLQNKETAMTILRSKLAQLQIEQHAEKVSELKGPNQSAEWGNQIRSYVVHPYKQVKDLRTRYETSDAEGVLNGDIDALLEAYLEYNISNG